MSRSTIALFAALLPALASGCFFGPAPLPAPAEPLEPAEQRQVLACQQKISQQVQQLQQITYKQLSKCLHPGVDLALDEERELTTATLPDFFERRQRLRERCTGFFETIGRASTKLIDTVIAKCAPVESLILGEPSRGDPLGLKGSISEIESVEGLAANYCGAATGSAEVLVSGVYMRTADLAWRYYHTTDEETLRSIWHASLDPRCATIDYDF